MKYQNLYYSILGFILLFAVTASSCVEGIDTDPKNLIGRWQMVKVVHQGKTILKPDRPEYYHEVEIEFLENGEVFGTLPTEDFTGDYRIFDEDSIAITRWKSSKKGIPLWGEYFFDNVHLVTTFSIKKKGLSLKYKELYLNYGDGALIFDRIE